MLRSSILFALFSLVTASSQNLDGLTRNSSASHGSGSSSISIGFTACETLIINGSAAICMLPGEIFPLPRNMIVHLLPSDAGVISFPNFNGNATSGSVEILDCIGGRSFQFPKAKTLVKLTLKQSQHLDAGEGCSVRFDALLQVETLLMSDAVGLQLVAAQLKTINSLSFKDLTRTCISMSSLSSVYDMNFHKIVEPYDCATGLGSPMVFPSLKTCSSGSAPGSLPNFRVFAVGAPGLSFPALENALGSVTLENFAGDFPFPVLTSVSRYLVLSCWGDAAVPCPTNTDVIFPRLSSIGERLVVRKFLGLSTLSFPALSVINGTMQIRSSEIKALEVPALNTVANVELSETHALLSVEMPALHSVSAFEVQMSDGTQSISLPNVEHIGKFEVATNKALTALLLPSLQSCDSIKVVTCASIPSLALPSLSVVNGNLDVSTNAKLTDLSFGSLSKVEGDFTVSWNRKLCFSMPPAVSVGGSTFLSNNAHGFLGVCHGDSSSASITRMQWMVVLAVVVRPLWSSSA